MWLAAARSASSRRRSSGVLLGLPTLRLRADYFAIDDDRLRRDRPLRRDERGQPDRRLAGHDRARPASARRPSTTAVDALPGWLQDGSHSGSPRTTRCWSSSGSSRSCCSRCVARSCERRGDGCCRSIREDEDAAASLGKNLFAVQAPGLALGAALAGVAGCFYAWQFSFFSPDDFQPLLTFFAWMIVILGGTGRVWAVPVGAHHLRRALRRHALLQLPAVLVARLRRTRLRAADRDRARAHRARCCSGRRGSSASARRWCSSERADPRASTGARCKRFGGVRAVDGATFDGRARARSRR